VHIPITSEPWNAKIWFFVSLAQLHLSYEFVASVTFNLYAFDWSPQLSGVRLRVFRGRACRRKFVVPRFDPFQASKFDQLE